MSAVMYGVSTAAGYLAAGGNSPSDVDPTTGKGPEWGEAAPSGLLIVVLLCVAVYFLVKSMNRNQKKVPDSFVTVGAVSTSSGVASAGDPASSASATPSASATSATSATKDASVGRSDVPNGPDAGPPAPADPR
jgi:hypothetical protein